MSGVAVFFFMPRLPLMPAFGTTMMRFLPITSFDSGTISRDLATQDLGVKLLRNGSVVCSETAKSIFEGIARWPGEGVYNVNILILIEGVLIAALWVAERLVEEIKGFFIVEDYAA
jgi:hypothetical protein